MATKSSVMIYCSTDTVPLYLYYYSGILLFLLYDLCTIMIKLYYVTWTIFHFTKVEHAHNLTLYFFKLVFEASSRKQNNGWLGVYNAYSWQVGVLWYEPNKTNLIILEDNFRKKS